jgi:hypothetical protein
MESNVNNDVDRKLDELTCELISECLDELANGCDQLVVATVMDAESMRETVAFDEDSVVECVEAARQWVRGNKNAGYYAVAYLGNIEEDDELLDALLVEFGARKAAHAWSAYVLVDGIGEGDNLRWCDPEPAGEVEPLLS